MTMKPWSESSALYQIYPRSFQDSNGDGIGDLVGISQRLDYLVELGVDGFWLSPIYESPQYDCGYDISNYYAIDPMFGTMNDMDNLIAESHIRGLKVVMDFVPNHTSQEHEWFREASSSRDNQYRDFYVWRDAKPDGSPPTNWISLAGGSAWQWHEPTQQYYLHSFMPEQPDLNWDNPNVRTAMHDVLRFWLDKGIDGFRVDAEWPISKVYADDPINPGSNDEPGHYGKYLHTNCKNGPNLLRYMHEMTDVVAAYDHRFMIFEYYTEESFGDPVGEYVDVFALNPGVAAPFVFDLFRLDWHAQKRADRARELYGRIAKGSLPIYCLGNHDQTRIASRYDIARARALAVLQMSLPGLPTVYYGDEIGMQDFHIALDETHDNFKEGGAMGGRDPERTPMRWTDGENTDFTTGTPWLPIGDNVATINVHWQESHNESMLKLYKTLIALRRDPVLLHGDYEPLDRTNGYCYGFTRRHASGAFACIVNFADQTQSMDLPSAGDVMASSDISRAIGDMVSSHLVLEPYEAVLIRMRAT